MNHINLVFRRAARSHYQFTCAIGLVPDVDLRQGCCSRLWVLRTHGFPHRYSCCRAWRDTFSRRAVTSKAGTAQRLQASG